MTASKENRENSSRFSAPCQKKIKFEFGLAPTAEFIRCSLVLNSETKMPQMRYDSFVLLLPQKTTPAESPTQRKNFILSTSTLHTIYNNTITIERQQSNQFLKRRVKHINSFILNAIITPNYRTIASFIFPLLSQQQQF